MKFIEYLQQPNSIYALMALNLAEGLFYAKDLTEWFHSEGVTISTKELERRWNELLELELAEYVLGSGYVLTEKGDKATRALMKAVNRIKKLK